MNCSKCGAPIEAGSKFCEKCGTPVEEQGTSGQTSYKPGGQGGYKPGNKSAKESNVSFDTKTIRRYFRPKRPFWPVLITIIGVLISMTANPAWHKGMFVLGILIAVAGILCWFYFWAIKSSYKGEKEADRAWVTLVNILKNKGMEKLSIIDEQVSLIDPVVIIGFGESPDASFEAARIQAAAASKIRKGIFRSIIGLFLKSENGTEKDPIELYRVGTDDGIRSMLIEVTVFWFTETQVLSYRADADISTGLIYRETTDEAFYQDIEAVNFVQSVYKVYNPKKKKYLNKRREQFVLFLGGCTLSASIKMDNNSSLLDKQFKAMRNLIREKKNS